MDKGYCGRLTPFDKKKMLALVKEGQGKNREMGFIKCSNGKYVEECEGKECSITLKPSACDWYATGGRPAVRANLLFHTHPEKKGVITHYFSPNDLGQLSKGKGFVKAACVGYLKNGKPKVRCVSSKNVPPVEAMNEMLEKWQPDKVWSSLPRNEKIRMRIRAVAQLNFAVKSCVSKLR